MSEAGEGHECACCCDRCKNGRETFLLPKDIAEIQADAIEHAAAILFDDHWNDNETSEAYTHLLNEAKSLKASAEPSNEKS